MGMFCGCCGATVECVVNSTIPAINKPFDWSVVSGVPVFDGQAIRFDGPAIIEATHGQVINYDYDLTGATVETNTYNKPLQGVITLDSVDSRILIHTHYVDEDTRITYDFRVQDRNSWTGDFYYPIVYLIKWERSATYEADGDNIYPDAHISSVMILDKWESGYQMHFHMHTYWFEQDALGAIGSNIITPGNGVLTLLTPKKFNSTTPKAYLFAGAVAEHSVGVAVGLSGDPGYEVNKVRIENVSGQNAIEYLTLNNFDGRDPETVKEGRACPLPVEIDTTIYCSAEEINGTYDLRYYWPYGIVLSGSCPVALYTQLPALTGDPCCGSNGGAIALVPRVPCSEQNGFMLWYVSVPYSCPIAPNHRWALDVFADQQAVGFSADADVFPVNAAQGLTVDSIQVTIRPDQAGTINYFAGVLRNDDIPTSRALTMQNHILPDDVIYPYFEPYLAAINMWVGFDHGRFIYEQSSAHAGYQCTLPTAKTIVPYVPGTFMT
jgi:hypothetical protein